MRRKNLFIISLICIGSLAANAQDYDDIYYNSEKKSAKTKITTTKNANTVVITQRPSNAYTVVNNNTVTVNGRDIDEYNRRYSSEDVAETDTVINDADFQYTDRIKKFHNPSVIIETNDPQTVEVYYSSTPQVNLIIGTPTVFVPAWSWYGFTRPLRVSYWNAYWDGYWDARFDPWYGPRWGWGWSRPWHWGYHPWGYRPYWGGRVIYSPSYPVRPGRHDWGYRGVRRSGTVGSRSGQTGRYNYNGNVVNHRGSNSVTGRRPSLPNRGNGNGNGNVRGSNPQRDQHKTTKNNTDNYNRNRDRNYNNSNNSNYNRHNSNNSGSFNSMGSRGGFNGGGRGGFGGGGHTGGGGGGHRR